ncbi:MAG: Nudix family hydrolase [Burkholderiaceae bacterium]
MPADTKRANMSQQADSKIIDVAVGVISRHDGQVLLAQRPPGKPYAGWWEFPGGKLEAGECVHQALARELSEELGLQVHRSSAWLVREHTYEHARVRLHFRRVTDFSGEPQSREGQAFTWSFPGEATVEPLLPATVPLMRLLSLPALYAISGVYLNGPDAFLDQLDTALIRGQIMVQLREPKLSATQFASVFDQTHDLCRQHGAILLVNSCHPASYWERADGVHLRSEDMASLPGRATGDIRRLEWIGASCHNLTEVQHAVRIGADFVTLSPVKPTRSHPGAEPIGWPGFTSLVEHSAAPAYALGGLVRADLSDARAAGAHGIAMIRGVFGPG